MVAECHAELCQFRVNRIELGPFGFRQIDTGEAFIAQGVVENALLRGGQCRFLRGDTGHGVEDGLALAEAIGEGDDAGLNRFVERAPCVGVADGEQVCEQRPCMEEGMGERVEILG